jgi:hypothetical protein
MNNCWDPVNSGTANPGNETRPSHASDKHLKGDHNVTID